jgi:hypothetical protein
MLKFRWTLVAGGDENDHGGPLQAADRRFTAFFEPVETPPFLKQQVRVLQIFG